jgi:hypothetical protein
MESARLAALVAAVEKENRAIVARIFARDPEAARAAKALSALAADSAGGETIAHLVIAAQCAAKASLAAAARSVDIAAQHPDAPLAVLQQTVRSLHAAGRLMRATQKGMSMLSRPKPGRQMKRPNARVARRNPA